MTEADQVLEAQIDLWRDFLRARQAIHAGDIAEMEDHLRQRIAGLCAVGLAPDEAFLVAVKRMGALDAISREFAREHSERLWKQLVAAPQMGVPSATARKETLAVFGLALAAAVAVKIPALFGLSLQTNESFYARNASLFVLPLLAVYFAGKRGLTARTIAVLAALFAAAAVFANIYPFAPVSSTAALTAVHLPMLLWLAAGVAYAGNRWRQAAGRMDFIRFTGEFFIYFVLIAMGGVVLCAIAAMIFKAAGIRVDEFLSNWLVPCGAAGAVIIGSWLVEAKQSVVENMAPVLARLFTPLFAALLMVFLATLLVTGRGLAIERELLIVFDLLLVLVLGLLLYAMSARDRDAPPGAFDVMQVLLLLAALLVDAVALWAIAARIGEFGVTPNRIAALGENAILLVNLAWSAVLYIRFLRRRGGFEALERWQTNYVPVYAAWAATVVIAFPPLFKYM